MGRVFFEAVRTCRRNRTIEPKFEEKAFHRGKTNDNTILIDYARTLKGKSKEERNLQGITFRLE